MRKGCIIMNKEKLIKATAEKSNMSQKDVKLVLDSYRDVVLENLSTEEKIKVLDIIICEVKETSPREERLSKHPRTGETITIPAKPAGKKVNTRTTTALKNAI